jgi:hypothetical protein
LDLSFLVVEERIDIKEIERRQGRHVQRSGLEKLWTTTAGRIRQCRPLGKGKAQASRQAALEQL